MTDASTENTAPTYPVTPGDFTTAAFGVTPSQTVGPYWHIGLPWADGPDAAPAGAEGRITLRNGGRFSGQFALVAGFADGSDGTVSLASGAQATDQQVLAGVLPGATGRLLVSGAGTRLTATGQLGLGGFSLAQSGGTGSLDISDGASVTTPQLRLWTAGSSVRIDGPSPDRPERAMSRKDAMDVSSQHAKSTTRSSARTSPTIENVNAVMTR